MGSMKRTPSPSILLVDDAVDERQMYADFFQTIGFRTLQAATALDAYRLAVELVPDAAVIDLILPGMNGLELVRMPVIALTGHSHPFDRQVALAAGCDRFLVKPCSPNDLLAEVRGLLARPKPGVERGHRRASVPRDGLLAG